MAHKLFGTLLITALLLGLLIPAVLASTPPTQEVIDPDMEKPIRSDNLPDPLTTLQLENRAKAVQAKLNGKASGKVYEAGRGQFVELERVGEGKLWTVLGEFADLKHNQIPEPDRTIDNSTIWRPDFDRQYYLDVLFNEDPAAPSMRSFYIEQSSNRYTVSGDVAGWVGVSGEAWTYDDDLESPLGGNAVWYFLLESVNAWYQQMLDDGLTPQDIDGYLSQFDVWDRYDWDGDGIFDEPDGYIDTFQSVFAGIGNEAGGGSLGDAAIWSHSWYAFYNLIGQAGPGDNLLGGLQIGESSYWIGKYTIQPENGGLGVFAHEFAHDLGLPDLYDTAGGQNGTGFWTLMSSGSWLSDSLDDIGSKPNHMGVWEKLQLGWLNYDMANAGSPSDHVLGPSWFNTRNAQALIVALPDREITTVVGSPYAGDYFYYSGQGDDLDSFMFRSFDLGPGSSLAAKVNYDIEIDWDYAYLVVSTNGGLTWTGVETSLSTTTNPNGQNFGFGITGSSRGWVDLTADLSAYTGDILLGFRYWTDGAVVEPGFMVDEIAITGYLLDGAETDAGWTFAGFRITTGVETGIYPHYYIAEFRQYGGYDITLKVGPYNFVSPNHPKYLNWVERFPYQDGLLIHYWDTFFKDNNTVTHPGQGLILPIDAHPQALYITIGKPWRNRIQTYDATFGLQPTDPLTLHWRGRPSFIPSLPAVRVFDDRILYYDETIPQNSVKNPDTGTQIIIKSITGQGTIMRVQVRPAP
jgi:immune inhibitor A